MIGQITPLVQAAGRRVWIRVVAAHLVGATLSASILGVVLGVMGLAIGMPRWGPRIGVVGGAILLACALRDSEIWRWPLPTIRRQTPAWFRSAFGPLWSAFAWGADLGQGWTTHITFTGYYALVLGALLSGSPAQGGILMGAYGLGRALPVVAAGLVGHESDLGLAHLMHLSLLQRVNAMALAVSAGYLLAGWTAQYL